MSLQAYKPTSLQAYKPTNNLFSKCKSLNVRLPAEARLSTNSDLVCTESAVCFCGVFTALHWA